jgi:translocator protein
MKSTHKNPYAAAIALSSVIITMILGSYFTNQNVNTTWYKSIKHPTLAPPSYVFPIVWTTLYALIAWCFYSVLQGDTTANMALIALYVTNLALNVMWCYLFFARQQPRAALAILFLIWVSTVWIIYIQRAWLLILYLLWLTFAMVLNKYAALQ